MSLFSKRISPFSITAGGEGINLINDSAVIDFPHPDSPTMPSVDFSLISNDTPLTALALYSGRLRVTWRSLVVKQVDRTLSLLIITYPIF